MQGPFKILPYRIGPAANLYTIHFIAEGRDELTRFLDVEDGVCCDEEQHAGCRWNECRRRCQRPQFLQKLTENLAFSTEETGFRDSFFCRDQKYPFPTGAFKVGTLRLYGIKYGREVFVAGGGGVKLVRRIQDDPILSERYKAVKVVAQKLEERIRRETERGNLPYDKNGNLHLPDFLCDFS